MTVSIGSDHAGFELKGRIQRSLIESGYQVLDLGSFDGEAADYPDYALLVAQSVASQRARFGILICGTGIGMAMAANKVAGIRAAVCSSAETARMSRLHNDANILCLGARALEEEAALQIVRTWLTTDFDGGDRHRRRVHKIAELENRRL